MERASEIRKNEKDIFIIVWNPKNDVRWQLYTCLLEIIRILEKKMYEWNRNKNKSLKFTSFITKHHKLNVLLIKKPSPKLYFMLYYCRIVRRLGPLISSMWYEAAHGRSKVEANKSSSKVNITCTMAINPSPIHCFFTYARYPLGRYHPARFLTH